MGMSPGCLEERDNFAYMTEVEKPSDAFTHTKNREGTCSMRLMALQIILF